MTRISVPKQVVLWDTKTDAGAVPPLRRIARRATLDAALSGTARTPGSAGWRAQHPYAYALNNPLNLVDPSGLGPGDVLRDLFSLPMRAWTTYWDEHYCLSLWDALKDIHTWELVATYFLYAYIPFFAAEVAPWLLFPLVGMETSWLAGGAVLLTAAVLAGIGTAALNAYTGRRGTPGWGWQRSRRWPRCGQRLCPSPRQNDPDTLSTLSSMSRDVRRRWLRG